MRNLSGITRISISITMLCVSVILLATLTGLMPDERKYAAESRAKLCETIAASTGYMVANHQVREAGMQLELFAKRNPELRSVALRRPNGEMVIEIGKHAETWDEAYRRESDGCYTVPIKNEDHAWGELQFNFQPIYAGTNQYLGNSLLRLLGMVAVLVGVTCRWQLRRILKYLDPSRSVPPRVREALDGFAEGVVILDTNDRITLVNQGFADYVKRDRESLVGVSFWSLPWQDREFEKEGGHTPSPHVMRGSRMQLSDDRGRVVGIFSVNSSPVMDDNGEYRGVMMAFSDITQIELNRAALLSTLEDLSQSKQEIADQNKELQFLASRDPLTSCVNRRVFFELFEELWDKAKSSGMPLGCVMVDIDFFKSINDTYGHSMGDEVLKETGRLLNSITREEDMVCRYGGEEFTILMPGLELEAIESISERIRCQLSELKFPDFSITASLGVSAFRLGAASPQDLLDQADKCLYVAKRNGRNQVVRYDRVPADLVKDETKISREKVFSEPEGSSQSIPYAAVTALHSALSYRDRQTASHSSRVANYAAMLAQRFLKPSDVYVVEIAALLHDIGKIGVPDAILLKPGKLNEEEWKIMEKHDQVGVEILDKAFRNPTLTDIVRFHHFYYAAGSKSQSLAGDEIPLGARILTIADAFDAMVSDRPYRNGMAIPEALAELIRCAGTQFDPHLVEHFIAIIKKGNLVHVENQTQTYTNDVLLSIGEQVERIVTAADRGDSEAFVALTERLRNIAEQSNVEPIVAATTRAIEAANEDDQIESLVKESFELLAACRAVRINQADATTVL
ncbi:MAG: diguanylate cyclase [Planctomycetales bacterium]|nr:diguanylate cyclase [Planctomycetales bacterium]